MTYASTSAPHRKGIETFPVPSTPLEDDHLLLN